MLDVSPGKWHLAHAAAITTRLLVSGGPRFANGTIGTGGEIEWKVPTRPGDRLHIEGEVLELIPSESRPDRGIAVMRFPTVNQDGKVIQTFTAKLMVARRMTA